MNKKASILIVDDDESIRKSLALIVKSKKYGVGMAGTGQEALEKARSEDINVALVDLKLPDMAGVNLIAPLKEMHPELAVIMITGFASVETAIQALNKGASAYITKPLNIDELCAKVEEALEKQRLLEENKRLVLELKRELDEHKKAEKERERLLNALAEKTEELEQIIYVISHDMRSPLVNIQGFSKELDEALKKFYAVLNKIDIPPALRKKLASTMNRDLAKSLQYIIASSAKMDSLLSGLLKLSRMGRDTLRIKKLDMSELIPKVISSFKFQIKQVDATAKVEELPPCYGDETQIDQVFSNLVGNALKFLDPKRRGVIRVSGKKEKEQAVYCVEDNGIGIAEKDKDAIFEMFRKLNPDDKGGEGLGLTIVRKIMERHGGKVWVESEPGQGSKFFVSLPDISR